MNTFEEDVRGLIEDCWDEDFIRAELDNTHLFRGRHYITFNHIIDTGELPDEDQFNLPF